MANKTPKIDSLISHNKRLKARNVQRVKSALERMLANSEEVNIARLSEKTGVSRSTIYRDEELRVLIDKFRETSVLRRNRELKHQKELGAERAAQAKLKTVTDALKAERLESARLKEENRRLKEHIGVLGIFPRKRTKASVAPAIPGLPDGVTSHFLTVLEYFG